MFGSCFGVLGERVNRVVVCLSVFVNVVIILATAHAGGTRNSCRTVGPGFTMFSCSGSSRDGTLARCLGGAYVGGGVGGSGGRAVRSRLFTEGMGYILVVGRNFDLSIIAVPNARTTAAFRSTVGDFAGACGACVTSNCSRTSTLTTMGASLDRGTSISLLDNGDIASRSKVCCYFDCLK